MLDLPRPPCVRRPKGRPSPDLDFDLDLYRTPLRTKIGRSPIPGGQPISSMDDHVQLHSAQGVNISCGSTVQIPRSSVTDVTFEEWLGTVQGTFPALAPILERVYEWIDIDGDERTNRAVRLYLATRLLAFHTDWVGLLSPHSAKWKSFAASPEFIELNELHQTFDLDVQEYIAKCYGLLMVS